ncbi:MAG: DUF1565 domain-containing protein [Candidatus Eisenbacteria bacterium]|nr:DUF1565 domain-containing protein [Candidatus Eisenbacteria bacterium]
MFSPSDAATLSVPSGSYPTIAAALAAARNGDRVLLAPGTYAGGDNVNLSFAGKAITVESSSGAEMTTIDCGGSGRGFSFVSGEGNDSVLRGITIVNGFSANHGGGILCVNSTPTIENVAITGCAAWSGGGLAVHGGNPQFARCTIAGNRGGVKWRRSERCGVWSGVPPQQRRLGELRGRRPRPSK